MDKVTIHIKEYTADILIIENKIIEKNQRTKGTYTKVRSLLNVEDPGSFKQRFIEDMGREIYNQNRNAEIRAIEKRSMTIDKLLIFKIE